MIKDGHVVHLLEKDCLYGMIGNQEIDKIPPIFSTIPDLLRCWEYTNDITSKYLSYQIIDLGNLNLYSSQDNLFPEIKSQLEQSPMEKIVNFANQ